jgi:alpha-glucosidase
VAAVVQPGQQTRPVYLPGGCGWYDFWSGDYYRGGSEVVLSAPWDRPPLLARAGCAIPLNVAEQHFAERADLRGFAVFPHRTDGWFECECFEDDGESEAWRDGHFWTWRLQIESSVSELAIKIEREGEGCPEAGEIILLLPPQETRRVHLRGGSVARDTRKKMNRELRVGLTS